MSPAPATARQRRKHARPQEMMDAALSLFCEKGLSATRMEEVAARVGVSKGTLYLYFPGKEALFKAVVRQSLVALVADGLREATSHTSPTERLRQQIPWWVRLYRHPASAVFKLVMTEFAHFPDLSRFYQDEVLLPGLMALRDEVVRGIACGEFQPVDPDLAVQSLIGPLVLTCIHRHTLAPRHLDTNLFPHGEAFIAHHVELVLAGLKSGFPRPTSCTP